MDRVFIEETIDDIESLLESIRDHENVIQDHLDSIDECTDGINSLLEDIENEIFGDDEEVEEESTSQDPEDHLREVLIKFENYLHDILNENRE